jgi:DNA excision repair protein ERCC-6
MHQVDAQERRECIHVATTQNGILITSYETLRITQDELLEAPWGMIVLDEGQRIRNPEAGVTKAVKRFSTPNRIILSGSPIQNNLQELWSLFDFINPGRLGTISVFLEEFRDPIEKGTLTGATEIQVATAYQCAIALRELTMPCILRRTKLEVLDVLQLPSKQEQVLFCNMSPEQYQVYVDFLQTDQVQRARAAATDRRAVGAVFFSLSVLRKLCNHPDLLLLGADPALHPDDMWNFERSGKMKVLAEVMKIWKTEGHRALIFVQTIQMLEVIEKWMVENNYAHSRIDGKTSVKRRLRLIEEFNGNSDLFAMILTTRVGGVGLNIIGANRVVIFDPDWNPMTDVQARERAWRIGQKKEVAVYRLVLTGTLEEKIYQRQVYKHFLAQKVLIDPRQRQFFKWSDVHDLFEKPPAPPGFDGSQMGMPKTNHRDAFKTLDPDAECNETTELMQAISDLPVTSEHSTTKKTTDENSALLQTLFDSNGIKTSFNHDKVEQPLLDRRIVREGARNVARRAVEVLKMSSHEARVLSRSGSNLPKREVATKREPGVVIKREPDYNSIIRSSGTSSADILAGLRQLAQIRSVHRARDGSQAEEARRRGFQSLQQATGDSRSATASNAIKREIAESTESFPEEEADTAAPKEELHESDQQIAKMILASFLNSKLAGSDHKMSTDQVLNHLAGNIAVHHQDVFKSLLKELCVFSKAVQPGESGTWSLRPELWPDR